MPENLWKLRARKGYSVTQLAAKSGIPQQLLFEYEQGKPLKPGDQARLARALYVQPNDIAVVSAPPPSNTSSRAASSGSGALGHATPVEAWRSGGPPHRGGPAKPRGRPKDDSGSGPARESQLTHLKAMALSRGHALDKLVATLGKPLESLTAGEASKWNLYYRDLPRVPKAKPAEGTPGSGVRRAALPEGLDRFEYEYLTTVQQSQSPLTVKLFNGDCLTGQLIGFGLYTFTLRLASGDETTLQKLAIAYYTRAAGGAAGGTAGAAEAQV